MQQGQGHVKYFNADKRYGFIVPDGGGSDASKDVFFPLNCVQGPDEVSKGQRVEYECKETPRGLRATKVVPL